MGRVKQLKPFVKVYVGLILAFFVSMALVFCIPDSWIQDNVNSSIEIMDGEGSYPMYFFYRHNSIMDVHTEGVMYNGLIPNRDYNPIQASVSINQYPRYWHGYMLYLRPLSVLFQITEIRYLGMLAFQILLFWSAWMIAKKTRPAYAVLYVLSIATGNAALSSVCLQFLSTFLVLFVSIGVLMSGYEKLRTKELGFFLFFFVVGMMENFFDFLTYPIITLGIPLILLLWMRVRDEKADLKDNLLFTIWSSISWGVGYALTWIAKWGITTVVLGVRYFIRNLSVIEYRLNGSEEEPLDRIGTLQKNLKAWLNIRDNGMISWSKVVIVIAVIALILLIWKKAKDMKTILAYLPMLLVAAYPYIWYLVMSNHSQIHYWYTYRNQVLTLFAGLIFLASILKSKNE